VHMAEIVRRRSMGRRTRREGLRPFPVSSVITDLGFGNASSTEPQDASVLTCVAL
jgi:hypothetical protein